MKKSDLKSRMVVEQRNGNRKMVIFDDDEKLMFMGKDGWADAEKMTEDMDYSRTVLKDLDIMKVFPPVLCFNDIEETQKAIWERHEGYSGKVICINDCGSYLFTKGKVYDVRNGALGSDKHTIYKHITNETPYKSLDEINEDLSAQFIAYKG